MTSFISVFFPVTFLFLACFGIGEAFALVIRRRLPCMPIWLETCTNYFFGQYILCSFLIFMGIAGFFSLTILLTILIPAAVFSLFVLRAKASKWKICFKEAFFIWKRAALEWRIVAALLIMLIMLGATTIGGWIEGDAIAFYLAISKVTAASQRLAPLPGYESFSAVGLSAEMLTAVLFALGMPNISPRIFSWVNFIPTVVVLYGLSRQCQLKRRGAIFVIVMVSTSSAVVLLWGSGKTDLFAVGPALCACLFLFLAWDSPHPLYFKILAGLFTGSACVFKISYLVPLVFGVAILLMWQQAFAAYDLFNSKQWNELRILFFRTLKDSLLVGAGFLSALGPHIYKNVVLLDTVIGVSPQEPWFSFQTTLRLLLSYPLALTFGKYWAQFGTLSPLVLTFAPLIVCLPRPIAWRHSKMTALAVSASGGLLLWIGIMPSVFAPRYYLATLLMCSIPAAAAADEVSRKGCMLKWCVWIAATVTIVTTPFHSNARFHTFDLSRTLHYPTDLKEDCLLSAPSNSYCAAHQAINDAAGKCDRVLLLTYYRYWLRPDLLRWTSTQSELQNILREPNRFWIHFYDNRFRFILLDESIFQIDKDIFQSPPNGTTIHEIYREGSLVAYKVVDQRAPTLKTLF